MRSLLPALAAALTAAAFSWTAAPAPPGQDPTPTPAPQDETPRRPATFGQMRAARIAELEKELVGCWILNHVEMPDRFVEKSDVNGYVVFQDGLMASSMRMRDLGGFFGTTPRYAVQSGLHRYRISDIGQLQMANVQSFSSMNDALEMVFDPPPGVRQYDAEIANGILTLRRSDGALLMFNRIAGGEFPAAAADQLRRYDPNNPLIDDRPRR